MEIFQNLTNATEAEPNLKVINLPAGDHPGFDIDFWGWTGNQRKYSSQEWLSKGFDGVLFQGAGKSATRIMPHADSTIFVGRHDGVVAFKDLSIGTKSISGKGKAIHMGTENPYGLVHEKFMCMLENVELFTTGRSVWGCFGYQNDWYLKNVTFNLADMNEHGLYAHGFAKKGAYFENVTVNGVGAECLKFTARPHECKFVKDALIWVKNSTFKNWYQPWSWRGGAGFVAQASTAHILIENTYYWGDINDYNRSRCIFIDGNGPGDYNAIDGSLGNGPFNGHIALRNVAIVGADGPDWYTPIMRIGNQSTTADPHCARTFTMDNCGVYGKNRQIQIHGPNGDAFKGTGVIKNCNTQQIRNYLAAVGMRVNDEALIDRPGGFVPVSQGIQIVRD